MTARKVNSYTFRNYIRSFSKEDIFNVNEVKNKCSDWPPDMFLITSKILNSTGVYKYVLNNDWGAYKAEFVKSQRSKSKHLKDQDGQSNWQNSVEFIANDWIKYVSEILLGRKNPKPPIVLEIIDTLFGEDLQDIEIDSLRTYNREEWINNKSGKEKFRNSENKLIKIIITLHVIADEACTGLGLIANNNLSSTIFRYIANMLLISRGSLSTFPKYFGVVAPKLKTPSSGMTLRSLSHHATYHSTEVEILWRNFPWYCKKNTQLNILSICHPSEDNRGLFHEDLNKGGKIGYFHLHDPCTNVNGKYMGITSAKIPYEPLDIAKVIARIEITLNKSYDNLDLILFPESALSEAEFRALLIGLTTYKKENLPHFKLPMIIVGVRRSKQINNEFLNEGQSIHVNELRIAINFADKWYFLSQRKHHRWKLDRGQINQYSLSNRLTTQKHLFEHIEISQRRLSLISLADNLTICPLICEDLARLEPVSEVIRGIGPSLLLALLSDGPQLDSRWSARYASVFADDPGTSVLSITSMAMAKNSLPPQDLFKNNFDSSNKSGFSTLGLWKDAVEGYKTIQLDTSQDESFVMTVSSQYVEELTADGRSDHGNGTNVKIESVFQLSQEKVNKKAKKINPKLVKCLSLDEEKYDSVQSWDALKNIWQLEETNIDAFIQDWTDNRELSAAYYAIDTMMDLTLDLKWKNNKIAITFVKDFLTTKPRHSNPILKLLSNSLNDPANYGIATQQLDTDYKASGDSSIAKKWSSQSLKQIEDVIEEVDKRNYFKGITSRYKIYYTWINIGIALLDKWDQEHARMNEILKQKLTKPKKAEISRIRMKKAYGLLILAVLHSRTKDFQRTTKKGSEVHEKEKDRGLSGTHGMSYKETKFLISRIDKSFVEFLTK